MQEKSIIKVDVKVDILMFILIVMSHRSFVARGTDWSCLKQVQDLLGAAAHFSFEGLSRPRKKVTVASRHSLIEWRAHDEEDELILKIFFGFCSL